MPAPQVTFAIASYNAAAFLADAVRSALAQRGVTVEVIVVDDGSRDDSVDIAEWLAFDDARVTVLRTPENRGPGGARNLALEAARGTWFAVLDSDDLIHPDRTARLLAAAEAAGADLVADDLLLFDNTRRTPPTLFLDRRRAAAAGWIGLPDYLHETRMFGRRPNLGFLKPMIRTAFLRDHRIRYDEQLRIAEDDALIVALLRAGARYRLEPQPLYFYRKHGASISHRLSADHVERMWVAGCALRASMAEDAVGAAALAPRHRALARARAFTHLLDALKQRRAGAAVGWLLREPTMLPLLAGPIGGVWRRLRARIRPPRPAPAPEPGSVLFISRRRLIGATDESAAYLLAIARAVRAAGMTPHLVQPSPRIFDRTPIYRLRPEMAVFTRHTMRGGWRIGPWLVARDPRAWFAGRGYVAAPLPHSISPPWTREDLRCVADLARHCPGIAIADDVSATEALPYLLSPALRTATVLHARPDRSVADDDDVARLDRAREIALLSSSDAVLTPEATQAAFVEPETDARAILLPLPVAGLPSTQAHGDTEIAVAEFTAWLRAVAPTAAEPAADRRNATP